MDAQGPASTRSEDLEITARLRRLYYAKSIFLSGNRHIHGIVTGDLEKDSGIGAAFVGLSGGVKEARAKTQTGSHALAVADGMTHGLQLLFMRGIHFNIAEQSAVVTCIELAEMRMQQARKGRLAAAELPAFAHCGRQ